MKTEAEITEILHGEIDRYKNLNQRFIEAYMRGDSLKDLQAYHNDMNECYYRIIAFKQVLNQD